MTSKDQMSTFDHPFCMVEPEPGRTVMGGRYCRRRKPIMVGGGDFEGVLRVIYCSIYVSNCFKFF